MPYLKEHDKSNLEPDAVAVASVGGHLNFQFSALIDGFLQTNGLNYANINTVVGALECAKLELYRRVAAPYEDVKIKENGDVFDKSILTEENNG